MSDRTRKHAFRPALSPLEGRELLAVDFVAGVSGFPLPTDQVQVNYTSRGYTGAFDVALYRSRDTVLDNSDLLLARRSVVSRSATAPQTATLNFAPPIVSDPQRYFYIIQLNPGNKVPEPANARANNTWYFVAPYNQALFTDAQFRDTSTTVGQIRNFLAQRGSYFRNLVLDYNNRYVDLSQTIATASSQFRVNPKILLTLLENQVGGVTSGARPASANIMGNSAVTWAGQVVEAARLYNLFFNQSASGIATGTGWRRQAPRNTLDNINVVPANNAMTALFSYTPYAGTRWGGSIGGMFRFTNIWRSFGF